MKNKEYKRIMLVSGFFQATLYRKYSETIWTKFFLKKRPKNFITTQAVLVFPALSSTSQVGAHPAEGKATTGPIQKVSRVSPDNCASLESSGVLVDKPRKCMECNSYT